MKNIFWLTCLLVVAGCASSVSRQEFLAAREATEAEKPVLIDVRTAGEYGEGHVPGAINISVFTLPFRIGDIPVKSKSDPVVVYCAHGPRAGLAGFILRVAGFTAVQHLEGDIMGWLGDGHPLETSSAGADS